MLRTVGEQLDQSKWMSWRAKLDTDGQHVGCSWGVLTIGQNLGFLWKESVIIIMQGEIG